MENIPVTTYRGFSAVSGETTFTQDMADIRNGKHAKLIIKIASLVAQGKVPADCSALYSKEKKIPQVLSQ